MFKELLVPLDGSPLAEAALPAAAWLARIVGAAVTLLHVIERGAPQEVHGERHLNRAEEAEAYLNQVARRAFLTEITVKHHVHTAAVGNVARSIVDHAAELASPLVVMCTHGRGGLRDLLVGSIAQQVIAPGTTTVFLVDPASAAVKTDFAVHRILVPLDGDPEHENGLKGALALAQVCGASLHLLMVVPTPGTLSGQWTATRRLMPAATSELLELARDGAEHYLEGLSATVKQEHLQVRSEVTRGDPLEAIANVAEREAVDLLALGTHGKAGIDAFWAGSVTPRIAGRCRVSLLLVPVAGPGG